MEELGNKDVYGMRIAEEVAKMSKDPNTKVGSCILSKGDEVLSVGCNDIPRGWKGNFTWNRNKDLGMENTKYPYVIHSECNAISNYVGDKSMLEEATLYVTLFPCNNCSKLIIQSGIKRIVYKEDKYKNDIDNRLSKLLLSKCGIEFIQYDELIKRKNKVYVK